MFDPRPRFPMTMATRGFIAPYFGWDLINFVETGIRYEEMMFMNAIAILLVAQVSEATIAPDLTYNIIEIKQKAQFAGQLGQRFQESMVIENGSQRYVVQIDGKYHTAIAGKALMVKVGDKITFARTSNPMNGKVRREDIRKVK
jgi:hypothetical protein